MTIESIKKLARVVAQGQPHSVNKYSFGENQDKFTYEELNDTLREEFKTLAGNYSLYRENKNTVFSIIEEAIDAVLPKKVLEQFGQFAEIKTFNQGDRPEFVQKVTEASRKRAKQFITKVGLAGIYEVFKLDGKTFEIPTTAYGGAAQIGFEEFLDGRVDFADLMEVLMEGLDECVYIEIQKALMGTVTSMSQANKVAENGFVESEMDRILAVVDSYGPATIYCTFEFAATMVPSEGWVSDEMRNQKWSTGYLGNYKGHKVVVLPQSYTDETNTQKVIDPGFAWIFPTGSNKPVRIAFEGDTIVDEFVNADRSREIQVYKKFGVGAMVQNNIGVYINTTLTLDPDDTESDYE